MSARVTLPCAAVALWLTLSVQANPVAGEPVSSGGPPAFRRLSADEYKRSIADIFGADIAIPGRFEPPVRIDGLLAIGSSKVVVTPTGFEQDLTRAREIASQVTSEAHRKALVPCSPGSAESFDEPCARQFLTHYGRLLFHRPLSEQELRSELSVSEGATQKSGSFYKGLESGLTRLLISPAFLFRMEIVEPDQANGSVLRLDDYSLAARISFLLWDAPPDDELLTAAARGELQNATGLERQVNRLMSSPRFEVGVRAFFTDMLAFDQFDGLAKDPSLFPVFNPQLRQDAQEQTLRTIVDQLLVRQQDYRELFTTKSTFLTRSLGALYGVPVTSEAFEGWMPYTFGPNDPYAGLLSLSAFAMLDASHEGRTSPTIRGKNVRQLLLCQNVPNPPANVNQQIVQDTNNPVFKTARERLQVHQSNPVCAGCHSITDPIGLAMENYTAVGQYRTQENGSAIDASGLFEKKPFKDLGGLEKRMTESPALTSCLVRRVYEYGVGRQMAPGERDYVKSLDERFASQGYRFPMLVHDIATSQAFRAVAADAAASGANTVAATN
jgi:Protein of unknown function (DUF1592)/Protein of unknown function (DUF1588)/Protein of unknown function (DUF1585)/Protein of unknown function (DUF1595)/Protein of unknown function (DUF1587)